MKLLYVEPGYIAGMGERRWAGIPSYDVTSHSGQLSLLSSARREMSIGQSAVMLCDWEVEAGRLIPFVHERVGGR